MRKALLLILVILFSTQLKAQPYESVFHDSITVHICKYSLLGSNTILYAFFGDTIVNGFSYRKVAVGHGGSFTKPAEGLVREDTMSGKVWYRSISPGQYYPDRDTIDKLVMDLTLQKGDSFNFGVTNHTHYFSVVDTIYIENGKKHIKFNKISFIEGEGTSISLCYKDSSRNSRAYYGWLVECIFKGTAQEYTSLLTNNKPFVDSCFGPTTIPNITEDKETTTIYPNPSNGVFTVTIPNKTKQVYITTINGELILRKEVNATTKELQFNLSDQPKGIYFLNLSTDTSTLHRKIVVH